MTKELEQWVLSHYGQEVYTPGLERISQAIRRLKPKITSRIVIIAGTNGKGETTHRLARQFEDSTFCAWTSPHILDLNERFSSHQGNISASELEALIKECHQIVVTENYQLTYYEFLFFVFCTWACKIRPQYLFLEVGLGGRLDAVNALDAELVLLTSISRDHQEFLGSRYDLILAEKLGVLRPHSTLMSFLELDYLRERASLAFKGHLDLNQVISLPSYAFSERNQFLAYAASCHLRKTALNKDAWKPVPGGLFSRGEVLEGENEWWLFGSHNVDGMRKLIQFLHSANYNFKDHNFDLILTSFSKRNERDVRVMLRMLRGAGLGEVVVTTFNHPKAYPKEELERLALQEGLKFVEDISGQVYERKNQKILVAGSYYLLGQLRPLCSGTTIHTW